MEGEEGLEPHEVFVDLGVLIVEGRTPGKCWGSGRGYVEGPHCRGPGSTQNRHSCDTSKPLCKRAEQFRKHMLLLWQNAIPMCIEVLLCPDCPCVAQRARSPGVANIPTSADLLLEQWLVTVDSRRCQQAAQISVRGLFQAVRSQLHFSQLSAWWSGGGATPRGLAHVSYRVTVPGEAFASQFQRPPTQHNFPVAAIARNTAIKVSVKMMPRMEEVPHVLCPLHPIGDGAPGPDLHEPQGATADAKDWGNEPCKPVPPDPQLGESLLDPPQSLDLFARKFQSPSRCGSPSMEAPEHLMFGRSHSRPQPASRLFPACRDNSPPSPPLGSQNQRRLGRQGLVRRRDAGPSWHRSEAAQSGLPELVDDRMQEPCDRPGKHHCRCDEDDLLVETLPLRAGPQPSRKPPEEDRASTSAGGRGKFNFELSRSEFEEVLAVLRDRNEPPARLCTQHLSKVSPGPSSGDCKPQPTHAYRVETQAKPPDKADLLMGAILRKCQGSGEDGGFERKCKAESCRPPGGYHLGEGDDLLPRKCRQGSGEDGGFERKCKAESCRPPGGYHLGGGDDLLPRKCRQSSGERRFPGPRVSPGGESEGEASGTQEDLFLKRCRTDPVPPCEFRGVPPGDRSPGEVPGRRDCATQTDPPSEVTNVSYAAGVRTRNPSGAADVSMSTSLTNGLGVWSGTAGASHCRLVLEHKDPSDCVKCGDVPENNCDMNGGMVLGGTLEVPGLERRARRCHTELPPPLVLREDPEDVLEAHRAIPSALDMAKFRRSLDSAASMVFHCRTGLPLTSSPAPARRGTNRFDYDSSLNSVSAIRSALFEPVSATVQDDTLSLSSDDAESEGRSPCSPGALPLFLPRGGPNNRWWPYCALAPCSSLLGSFEESVLNGRLEPVSTVQGFTADLGASGSFCPRHDVLPVTVFFYTLGDNDKVSTPYLAHINLGKKGYSVPRCGTIQVTLLNPLGTVVKMFVVLYDLRDMPANSQTFLRQRTLYMPAERVGSTVDDLCWLPDDHQKWLRYLIHLRFSSTKSGRLHLHSDIRMIIFRKSDLDTATAHGMDMSYELRSFTHGPTNPKFSPRK